jgi:hypothetical protein
MRPLFGIPDNHEKIVLSLDRSFLRSTEGIKTLNLVDFLLA